MPLLVKDRRRFIETTFLHRRQGSLRAVLTLFHFAPTIRLLKLQNRVFCCIAFLLGDQGHETLVKQKPTRPIRGTLPYL